MTYIEQLKEMNACEEAVDWCEKNHETLESAWQDCTRSDWMLWLLGKLSGSPESDSRKRLILCVCECARLTLSYVPEGENRPRIAIETAEKWARGEESVLLSDVLAAADAAYATVYATCAIAHVAADAAADAAYAAAHVAAYAAAYAANAASHGKEDQAQAKCADIVRKHYPEAPILAKGDQPCTRHQTGRSLTTPG
jgi:hypothetical protein